MRLTITREVEALIQCEMKSGHFKDVNDLIEAALNALVHGIPYTRSELDAMIQEGLNDIERGDLFTEEEARAHIAAVRAER